MNKNTGNKCSICGVGRIALMSAFITHVEKDSEPYTPEIVEGNREEVELKSEIDVCIHACDECGEVIEKWFNEEGV